MLPRRSPLPLLGLLLIGAARPSLAGAPVFAVREILDANGRRTPLSEWIADQVAERLVSDSGWIAVERNRIGFVAQEHALAGAGASAGGDASGTLLGVQRHVFGTYHPQGDGYLVALRTVDATTGAVLGYPKLVLPRNRALDSLSTDRRRGPALSGDGPLVLERCAWQGQVMIQCLGEIDASVAGCLDIPDDQDAQVLEDGSRVRFSYFTVDGASNDGRQMVRARSRSRVAMYFPASGRPEAFQSLRLRYRFGGRSHVLEGSIPIQ